MIAEIRNVWGCYAPTRTAQTPPNPPETKAFMDEAVAAAVAFDLDSSRGAASLI